MKKLTVLVCTLVGAGLVLAATASAFDGGGRKPSEAPLIAFGQHYAGQLNNHKADANFGGYNEVAFYRLPPVSTRDVVTVNWHALPFTRESRFPVCLILVQGIDDFNWGTIYDQAPDCSERGPTYSLPGSGTAATAITVQNTDSGSTYLEFISGAGYTEPSKLETFPYDFTVEAPRHFLGLSLSPLTRVPANGVIEGTVLDANGLPAPDGLVFGLTATWGRNGVASYTTATVGGHLAFQLALPESAIDERATIAVGRGADAGFQAAGARMGVNVKPPVAAPPSACELRTSRAHSLARQLHRLKRHASQASGRARRHLRHRAHGVGKQLAQAQKKAAAVC